MLFSIGHFSYRKLEGSKLNWDASIKKFPTSKAGFLSSEIRQRDEVTSKQGLQARIHSPMKFTVLL